MIYYFYKHPHGYTMRWHLAWLGKPLAPIIRLMNYDDLFKTSSIQASACIFSDLERLTPAETEQAGEVWRAVKNSGHEVITLNDPIRTMRRYELLRTLYEQGINAFNVYKLVEARSPDRYPVFVRHENDHNGNITPLLFDKNELQAAIAGLEAQGLNRESMLIVEYLDTTDEKKVYRKYSYFCVAGVLIPRHLFLGSNWVLKKPEMLDNDALEEERTFVETKPYLEEIRDVFRIARTEYGRIDFTLHKNRIQVWEINTNPYITSQRDIGAELRKSVQLNFVENFNAQLMQLQNQPELKIPLQVKKKSV